MLFFGFLIGGILIVAGLATYWFAPIVGPNPIFGVRVGYAYANRETWDKTNRFGGMLMAFLGVGVIILGWGLQLLKVPPNAGMSILTAMMLVALVGATAWMFVYARNLAQGTSLARELVPVRFRWAYLAPVLVTFVLLVLLMAYIYPTLPADRVPSHFNIHDQADGWQTRNEFVLTLLGMGALFVVLNLLTVFIATREPLVAFGRWGTSWRLDPERGLIFAGLALAFANLLFIAILWNIWWLTTRGALAFSFAMLLPIIVVFLGGIIAMFFGLARRDA